MESTQAIFLWESFTKPAVLSRSFRTLRPQYILIMSFQKLKKNSSCYSSTLSILLWQWCRIIVRLFKTVFKFYNWAKCGDTQYSGSWGWRTTNPISVVLYKKTVKKNLMIELHSIIEVCPSVFIVVCVLKQNNKLWISNRLLKEDSSHGSLLLFWIAMSFSLFI